MDRGVVTYQEKIDEITVRATHSIQFHKLRYPGYMIKKAKFGQMRLTFFVLPQLLVHIQYNCNQWIS
ncbi:hypothetical protein I3760_16G015000 [Carya illinoinensis]|nr:hypothetical protein I3760_16G015000 [Carya illinoinensis]